MEQKKQNDIKQFLQLIWSSGVPKFALLGGLLGGLVSTIVGLAIPLATREMIDGFSLASISLWLIGGIALLFILQAITDAVSTYLLGYVGQKIVAAMRNSMWNKLLRLPVSYFDKTKSGESVSRVINDTSIVKDLISMHSPQFVTGLITILGAIAILLYMDWKMTLLMLISVPIAIAIMIPLGSRMAKISRGLQDETAVFTGSIQQTLSEVRLMKASNAEPAESAKGNSGITKLLSYGLKEAKITALIGPLMYLVIMAVVVIIIGYGGIRVAEGSMSTGSLVAFLLYLFQIVFPITSFTMFFTQLQKAKGATERMIEILGLEEEEKKTGLEMDIGNKPITFEDVSFSYGEDDPILRNISFQISSGQSVAFAGPSGGGKTTLFGLIERFYEPQAGKIFIGETPINALSLKSWRSQIGYVSQDSPMMAGTIRENLLYGLETKDAISDDELWRVAEMAYADQFIKDFPAQLDTEVGERGVKLSGGQRQRIAIARAFLRNPKILMMDEATASLDSQSEAIVQAALNRLMSGRTTFMIAHRLSTIQSVEKIIFIEKGEITGIGSHVELMDSHDLYRQFAEQQLMTE